MISPLTWFPFHWYLVMLSTFPMYVDQFSVFYEKKCLLELFIHFSKSVSYFPAVVLKFVVVACIFWILASIQIKSLQILLLIL